MDLVTAYKNLTDAIELATGLSRPMLHLHAGMTIYLATQLLLGERRGSIVALAMVLVAELGNEALNRLYWGAWRWDDTLADIATTLFWPALCFAISATGRRKWRRALGQLTPRWNAPPAAGRLGAPA
jgi:hypothetical protein